MVAGPGPLFPSGPADQAPAQTAFDLSAILTTTKPEKAEPKSDADTALDNSAKPDTDAAPDANVAPDAVSDADAVPDADANSDAAQGAVSDTDTDANAVPDGDAKPDTDAAPETDAAPNANAVPDTDAVPDADANSDANAVSDADTDANAVPDADADPDLGQTRFDMVAVTSFDLPPVPDALPPAANDTDQTTQVSLPDFPAAGKTCEDTFDEMIDPDGPVPSSTPAPVPPAAVPRGTEDTRFDIPAVPEDNGLTEAKPATPADTADTGTQIFPVIAPIFAPDSASEVAAAVWSATGRDGQGPDAPVAVDAVPERKRRRGLVAVAGLAVLIAVVGVGLHFATGSSGPAADAAVGTSTVTASAPILKTGTSASASGAASASTGTSTSASGSPTNSAGGHNVTSLRIASVAAFGPGGLSAGDDQAGAGNAIAADPAQPWATQWYATPAFGGLKVGTGLLFNMGGDVTVTSVHLDLAPEPGGTLEVLVGNTATPGTFTVEATTSDIAGATSVTLRHPVAARYLLIWFTQLPPNGQGEYMESVSGVTVTGRS